MKTITLHKDGKKKEFTERAAKIASESFGWQEVISLKVPSEIGTKTRPPEIRRAVEPAVKELKPVPEAKIEPSPALVTVDDDLAKPDNKPASVPVKKTRKPPVRSKTTKR